MSEKTFFSKKHGEGVGSTEEKKKEEKKDCWPLGGTSGGVKREESKGNDGTSMIPNYKNQKGGRQKRHRRSSLSEPPEAKGRNPTLDPLGGEMKKAGGVVSKALRSLQNNSIGPELFGRNKTS